MGIARSLFRNKLPFWEMDFSQDCCILLFFYFYMEKRNATLVLCNRSRTTDANLPTFAPKRPVFARSEIFSRVFTCASRGTRTVAEWENVHGVPLNPRFKMSSSGWIMIEFISLGDCRTCDPRALELKNICSRNKIFKIMMAKIRSET